MGDLFLNSDHYLYPRGEREKERERGSGKEKCTEGQISKAGVEPGVGPSAMVKLEFEM